MPHILRKLCLVVVCFCLLFSLGLNLLDEIWHEHDCQGADCAICELLQHLHHLQAQLRLLNWASLALFALPDGFRRLGLLGVACRQSLTPVSLNVRSNN